MQYTTADRSWRFEFDKEGMKLTHLAAEKAIWTMTVKELPTYLEPYRPKLFDWATQLEESARQLREFLSH